MPNDNPFAGMREFLSQVHFTGPKKDWRQVPETAVDPDEEDDKEVDAPAKD